MKISELIEVLEELKKIHGDVEVFGGGEDYPGPIGGVYYVDRGDGYIRSNTVAIWSEDCM